jgi:hypothetical protein
MPPITIIAATIATFAKSHQTTSPRDRTALSGVALSVEADKSALEVSIVCVMSAYVARR